MHGTLTTIYVLAHDAEVGHIPWVGNPDFRGGLILALLMADAILVILLYLQSRRLSRQDARISTMVTENDKTQNLLISLDTVADQHLMLLAEMVGHYEVAMGKVRLSEGSQRLLERARSHQE